MKKIQWMLLVLLAVLSISFVACGGDDDPTTSPEDPTPWLINVESVSINVSTLNLIEGDSQTITVTISPTNAANKKYSFSSSNPEVATVDENGKITALKAGEAIITVTTVSGNKTATCAVKVEAKYIAVTSITLDNTSATLKVGDKMKINATADPKDATDPSLVWESSNSDIISVDEEGNVEALKIGEAVVIVSAEKGTIQATCEISVIPEAVTGVSLSDEEIKLMPGDTRQLTAIIEPDNADDQSVTWSVADKSIATVDQDGNVVGKKLGQTTVTVKTNDGGFTASCTINVVDITGMVTASILKGMYASGVVINGYLQPGSQISTYLLNESQYEIIPQSIQLIDGLTGTKGNLMEVDHDILKGQGVYYTITIRTTYYLPIVRWTYTYEGSEYTVDCQFEGMPWGTSYY